MVSSYSTFSYSKNFWFDLIILGPVPAITGALKKAGLTLNDMDLVEVCYKWKTILLPEIMSYSSGKGAQMF